VLQQIWIDFFITHENLFTVLRADIIKKSKTSTVVQFNIDMNAEVTLIQHHADDTHILLLKATARNFKFVLIFAVSVHKSVSRNMELAPKSLL